MFFSVVSFTAEKPKNKGPLLTNSIYPFSIPFINPLPESAQTLGEGNKRLVVLSNYGNTFNYDVDGMDNGFQLDMDLENLRILVDFDYGLTENIDIGAEISYNIQYGGFFDPVIQWFHGVFGFPNANRENVQDNLFRLGVKNDQGTWIDISEPTAGLGDILLKGKYRLYDDSRQGLFIGIQPLLKIPLGSEALLLSNGCIDFGVNLLAEKRSSRFSVYINLGWFHVGKPEKLTIFEFNNDLFSYVVGLEYVLNDDWSFYGQIDGNTSPYMSGHNRLDDSNATINVGLKTVITESTLLQVSFSEEFFTFATTDVTLIVAMIFYI